MSSSNIPSYFSFSMRAFVPQTACSSASCSCSARSSRRLFSAILVDLLSFGRPSSSSRCDLFLCGPNVSSCSKSSSIFCSSTNCSSSSISLLLVLPLSLLGLPLLQLEVLLPFLVGQSVRTSRYIAARRAADRRRQPSTRTWRWRRSEWPLLGIALQGPLGDLVLDHVSVGVPAEDDLRVVVDILHPGRQEVLGVAVVLSGLHGRQEDLVGPRAEDTPRRNGHHVVIRACPSAEPNAGYPARLQVALVESCRLSRQHGLAPLEKPAAVCTLVLVFEGRQPVDLHLEAVVQPVRVKHQHRECQR
eukprot:9716622-Heterocapsa_arctica.AAC.2